MRTTPIEQMLIDELVKLKIPHRPQCPIGWVSGYCRSKYPCKCGVEWCDPYTGEYIEGDGYEYPEHCDWFNEGHSKYFIDIFIEVGCGFAIEIDDAASHSSKYQIEKDKERQKEIIDEIDCQFIRFTAKKVFNEIGKCVKEIQEKIKDLI